MERKNKLLLIIIFSLTLNCTLMIKFFNSLTTSLSGDSFGLKSSQIYTGNYSGDISIMYFDQDSISSSEFSTSSLTQIIPHNVSRPGAEYKVNNLDIYAEIAFGHKIAGNISEQISYAPSLAFGQEFIYPDIEYLEGFLLYLNYSLLLEPISYYYWDVSIYDEFFTTEIDWFYNYEERKEVDEWMRFEPYVHKYNVSQKYNIVLRFYHSNLGYVRPFDFWKAENYTSPIYNQGATTYFNGTDFIPVKNDTTSDLLCYLLYSEKLNPSTIDIQFIINDVSYTPIYADSYVYYSHSFDAPLSQAINLTIISDEVIPVLRVTTDVYYINLIQAEGIYKVYNNHIEWVINYPYREIHYGWPPPLFLFEKDWVLDSLNDSRGFEMSDIYFGPVTLYNTSYYGIVTFFGPPLEQGNYTGTFFSPNYCQSINPQLKTVNGFISQVSFELGQTFRIEAPLISTLYPNVTDGIGQITLRNPSGQIIHDESNISPTDGKLISSEIEITNEMEEGIYEVEIFWSNGKEVAYYTFQFEVRAPLNLLLIIGLSLSIGVISIAAALVVRRQIRMRNWEKSLRNLFVLTKDGLSLYEYSFGIEIQDPALISGMIAALTQFVREATGSKKALRTVDQEDKKVLLYHGSYTTTALLAEKDLPIIHKRIEGFAEEFEGTFNKNIKHFSGEVSAFKNANIIVNKYFPLDVEEQVIRGVREKLIEFRERLNVLTDPRHIISLMREITEFISRYHAIVNEHYLNYYNEIIKVAEQKISG